MSHAKFNDHNKCMNACIMISSSHRLGSAAVAIAAEPHTAASRSSYRYRNMDISVMKSGRTAY